MDSVSQVEQALKQLYSSTESGPRNAAQSWLLAVQQSQEAWELVWFLLEEHKSTEVQFFGASTLAVKIHKYWHEVAPESFDDLRLRLFKCIIDFAAVAVVRKLVLGKLCVALAILLLNAVPDQWPAAFQSAVLTFNRSIAKNCNVWIALLEFLTVLPEEFHTHTYLSGSKKVAVRQELDSGSTTVLAVIEGGLQDQSLSPDVHLLCLRCLKSWVQFGVSLAKVEKFLSLLYNSLADMNLCEIAIDCLVEMAAHPNSTQYPLSVRKLISLTVQLAPELERMKLEGDLNGCHSISRLVVALIEAHVALILWTNSEIEQQEAVALMYLLLKVTDMPGCYSAEETCSETTFNAWYLFIDEISVQKPEVSQQLRLVFGDLLLSLLKVLLRKVQLPSDSWRQCWTHDEKEQFRCYREDIGDTAMYLHGLLGVTLFEEIHKTFQRQLLERDTTPWQAIEATLYLLRSVAENTTDDEDPHISAMISNLNNLPSHSQLAYRSMLVIGSYSDWLSSHAELLQCVLPLLLSGLSDREVAPAAAIALRDVGEVCAEHLTCLVDQLIPICQDAVCGGVLETRECVRVFETMAFVLSTLSVQAMLPFLEALFVPRAVQLKRLSETHPDSSVRALVHREMRLLSAICRTLDPKLQGSDQHPIVSLLLQVWKPVETLFKKWLYDTEIMDYFCGCMSGAVRVTQTQYAPVVQLTVAVLVEGFLACYNPLFLDVGAQLVGMFGKDQSQIESVATLVDQMIAICFKLFEITNLHDHTDVVQKLMHFLTWVVRSSMLLFIDLNRTSRVFGYSIAALSLPELPTVRATSLFLSEFIRHCSQREEALFVVSHNASDLLSSVLKAVGGGVPRHMLEPMTDVLLAMNKHCPDLLAAGLMNMVTQEGFPSGAVSRTQKEAFAKSVLREKVHKKRLQELVQEFYLVCRMMNW